MIQTHNFSSIKDKIIPNQNDCRKDIKDKTTLNQSYIKKAPVEMLLHYFYIVSRLVDILDSNFFNRRLKNWPG